MSGQVTHQCLHILHFQSCYRSTGIIDQCYCIGLYLGSVESVLRFSHCTVRILPTVPSPHSQILLLIPSHQSTLLCDVFQRESRVLGSGHQGSARQALYSNSSLTTMSWATLFSSPNLYTHPFLHKHWSFPVYSLIGSGFTHY